MSGFSAIPEKWISTKLGDICELEYGKALKSDIRDNNGNIPVYGSNGIVGKHSTALVTSKCIIVGRKGAAGEVHLSMNPCWPIDTTYYVRESDVYDLKYFFYLLKSLKLNQLDKSTAIPGLNRNDAYAISILLPPYREQTRIALKIEELFSDLDKGIESLKTAQQQLKVYRQAVLKWAFEGKLTNENVTDGELPSRWQIVDLGSIAEAVDPQPNHRTPPEVENGIPYVGIGDIDKDTGEFLYSLARKVSKTVLHEHRMRYKITEGDFIIGKIGTIGKPFKLPLNETYVLSANVVLVQANRTHCLNEYLFYICQSNVVEKQFAKGVKATTQAAFGIKKVRSLQISLCPLQEQRQVISEIESRLSVCDKIEETIEISLKQAEALRQSILKKAFEGKLVAKDPNDEPASVLLKKIQAEKAAASQEKKLKKTKKTTGK